MTSYNINSYRDRQQNVIKYPLPASPPMLSPLYFLFLYGLEDKFSRPDKQRESKVRDIAVSVVLCIQS